MSGRRVLFISYNFPPHGGAGVQRSVKFVKYLPQYGWQPLVIAGDPGAGPVLDESLIKDIPSDCRVQRVSAFSIYRLIARFRRLGLARLAVLANILLQLPDPARFWASKAYPIALQIINDVHPDAIYSTSGPYSAHLLALHLARRTHLPWLADFRDPWSTNLLIPYLPGYRFLNRRMERQVLRAASHVTAVSQPWLDDLYSNGGGPQEKFCVIPNGYDPEDVTALEAQPPDEPFTLTHLGSFYRNRRPNALVQAVDLLIERDQIPIERIRIRFIGRNIFGAIPNRPPFESREYTPHHELDEYRRSTSVFLLLLDTSEKNAGNTSGKVYEYIAANRPVLGVVPPGGAAQQLLEETRTGIAVGGTSEEIAAGILKLYRQWEDGLPNWDPDWEEIHSYSRSKLAERLASELDRLADARRPA